MQDAPFCFCGSFSCRVAWTERPIRPVSAPGFLCHTKFRRIPARGCYADETMLAANKPIWGGRAAQDEESARALQLSLLPTEIPQLPGFQIACAWRPSQQVSGDLFDVISLDPVPDTPVRLALCVADVSGKGPSAVARAHEVHSAVREYAPRAASPAELCTLVNRALSGAAAPAKYVTMWYGVLETSGRLCYESAGHCLPLLVRADGSVAFPASFSGILGIFSHWLYQTQEIELRPGDCLLIMTDGILQAGRRREEFGYRRLIAMVETAGQQSAQALASRIVDSVAAFCSGRFEDDASLIVVKAPARP